MPIGWTAWAKDIWRGPNRSGQLRLQAWKKMPGHGKEGPPIEACLEEHDSGPQQSMTPREAETSTFRFLLATQILQLQHLGPVTRKGG